MAEAKKETLHIRIEPSLKKKIQEAAVIRDISMAKYVNQAISEKLQWQSLVQSVAEDLKKDNGN